MRHNAPLVLISNDDGIHAPGLHVLAAELAAYAEVYIVAPHRERSAYSHCLTISKPLRIQKLEAKPYSDHVYEVDGTPVDCVKIAIDKILPRKPDWVITGINRGGNLGTDTLYSGTVGAAMEGVINGCKAMAFSCHSLDVHDFNYEAAGKVAEHLFQKIDALPLPPSTMLNVNVPSLPFAQIKGIRMASLGKRIYDDRYWQKEDPRGLPYYWLGADSHKAHDMPGSDCNWVNAGYASMTVLRPSLLCEQSHLNLGTILPELYTLAR